MVNRVIIPLKVIDMAKNRRVVGTTRFQKLVFILQDDCNIDCYKFKPKEYGPLSKTLQKDLTYLIKNNYIKTKEKRSAVGNTYKIYQLTSKGRRKIKKERSNFNSTKIKQYSNKSVKVIMREARKIDPQKFRNCKLNNL